MTVPRFSEIVDKFSSLDSILVVGDVGIDKYTCGVIKRISPEAPVPVLEVSKEWHKLGLAANVSDNLLGLKVTSTLCGVIGNDRSGDLFENLLEEKGLRTWGVVREENRPTTYKERVTTATQQICRVDYETNQEIAPETADRVFDRILDFARNHNTVILEDYGKGLFTPALGQRIIQTLGEQGKLVAVDPCQKTPPTCYRRAHLLKPNRSEAQSMARRLGYDSATLEEQAQILLDKLELQAVVITLGAKGMAFMERQGGELCTVPTVANEVFDVSGAGDTAISAITAALASGASLQEAVWIGNCASGVVVAKQGTAGVSQEELGEFFHRARATLERK